VAYEIENHSSTLPNEDSRDTPATEFIAPAAAQTTSLLDSKRPAAQLHELSTKSRGLLSWFSGSS
jgi:hypothetical protein